MLEQAGYAFEGNPHSGLDDSLNIARLVIRLLEDGCKFLVNESLFAEKLHENLKAFRGSNGVKGGVQNITRAAAEALESEDESSTEEVEEAEEVET